MKGGYLVEYTNKDGQLKKGRVMHNEQDPAFAKVSKSLVRLCDDSFNDLEDENGKKLASLVRTDRLTVKGYID